MQINKLIRSGFLTLSIVTFWTIQFFVVEGFPGIHGPVATKCQLPPLPPSWDYFKWLQTLPNVPLQGKIVLSWESLDWMMINLAFKLVGFTYLGGKWAAKLTPKLRGGGTQKMWTMKWFYHFSSRRVVWGYLPSIHYLIPGPTISWTWTPLVYKFLGAREEACFHQET